MANTLDWIGLTTRHVVETASFHERLLGWKTVRTETADAYDVRILLSC
jgi:predicted enzyme related to lactoylglutathione lyase